MSNPVSGPWTVVRKGDLRSIKGGGFWIADLYDCSPYEGDDEATASLIAAAPELRAALQSFVDWAEQHRAAAKAAGDRPAIDAARVRTAKAALARIR